MASTKIEFIIFIFIFFYLRQLREYLKRAEALILSDNHCASITTISLKCLKTPFSSGMMSESKLKFSEFLEISRSFSSAILKARNSRAPTGLFFCLIESNLTPSRIC